MTKQERKILFTFENPNRMDVFVQMMQKVLIDKLAAQKATGAAGV